MVASRSFSYGNSKNSRRMFYVILILFFRGCFVFKLSFYISTILIYFVDKYQMKHFLGVFYFKEKTHRM
jgi:hypothetical protein